MTVERVAALYPSTASIVSVPIPTGARSEAHRVTPDGCCDSCHEPLDDDPIVVTIKCDDWVDRFCTWECVAVYALAIAVGAGEEDDMDRQKAAGWQVAP